MTDDAATLKILRRDVLGQRRVTYHLERRPDGWMIRKGMVSRRALNAASPDYS